MTLLSEVILAFRPKTLTTAVVPCVAATALVRAYGLPIDLSIFVYALLSALCIQIGTNLVNDAVDFEKGADTQDRVGPRRITQAGVLSSRQVMALAGLFFFAAVLLAIPLVLKGGWPLVVLGLLSILMGYAYTAGPFPLAYLGLGDLFVVIFFGLVAVGGMHYLQAGVLRWEALWLGLQIGFLATVLIAINNLRDHQGDALVGKKTWAVRFGVAFSRGEILFLIAVPFLMNAAWWTLGFTWAALLPLLLLPWAADLIKKIFSTSPGPVYNQFLARAALLHLGFGLLLSLGLVWK